MKKHLFGVIFSDTVSLFVNMSTIYAHSKVTKWAPTIVNHKDKQICCIQISGHFIELPIQCERLPKYRMELGIFVLEWCGKHVLKLAN